MARTCLPSCLKVLGGTSLDGAAAAEEDPAAEGAAGAKRRSSRGGGSGSSGKKAKADAGAPVAGPQDFIPLVKGELRDYQLEGVKVRSLRKGGGGGGGASQGALAFDGPAINVMEGI